MKSFCAVLVCLSGWMASAAEYSVRVETGPQAHSNVVLRFLPPDDTFPSVGMMMSQNPPQVVHFQKAADGHIVFVLPAIGSQSVKRFTLAPNAPAANRNRAHADLENGQVKVSVGEKKLFVYQGEESELPRDNIKPLFKRGGYFHPIYSPSGRQVTDDYPPNHVHHHGIWFPWTKTTFEGRAPDFWNMGDGKGKVEFVKLNKNWSGPVHAGFEAEHRFVDLTSGSPKAALNETWQVTAYDLPNSRFFAFDLVSTQTCASSSPLLLPKYHYGGLGFRGNWAWNGEKNCVFLTSNGETDRIKGNETRGNWVHIGGEVDGQFAGVAVLSHPDNFRSPQPMRLHPSEPFFCFAPSQVDDWKIEPGKPYVSKYRFIVSDGSPEKGRLDQLWESYAHPPKVVVEKL
ncbi:MAG: DUF6807 domain-containing protein [Limisphaerales bacterium]